MKAQDDLQKILTYEAVLECKEEELARLKSLAEKITANMDGEVVSSSKNLDPLGEAWVRVTEKEREIETLKENHKQLKSFYIDIIDNMRKPVFIKILYGKYFFEKTLQEIADEEGYTYRNICYLHGNALQAVENAIKKE